MFFPLFTVFLAVRFANCLVDLCGNVTSLCVEQQSCRDCLRVHHCCNWCYEPAEIEELQQTKLQLQDQNTLLKTQLLTGAFVDSAPNLKISGVADGKVETLERECAEKDVELGKLRKDQDDLLELLADQDTKLNSFKSRLRELGENIEDDDDSDVNSAGSENDS